MVSISAFERACYVFGKIRHFEGLVEVVSFWNDGVLVPFVLTGPICDAAQVSRERDTYFRYERRHHEGVSFKGVRGRRIERFDVRGVS